MTPFHPRARRTNNCTSAIHIRRSRMRQKGDETSLTQKPQNPQNPHLPRARRVTVHLTRLIPPWQYLMRERIRLPTVSRLLQCFWLWINAPALCRRSWCFSCKMWETSGSFYFFFLYSPPFLIERLLLTGSLDYMLTVVETPNLRGQFGLSYFSSDD